MVGKFNYKCDNCQKLNFKSLQKRQTDRQTVDRELTSYCKDKELKSVKRYISFGLGTRGNWSRDAKIKSVIKAFRMYLYLTKYCETLMQK